MLKMRGSAGYWRSSDRRAVFERRVRLKKYEKTSGNTQLVRDQRVAGAHHSAVKSAHPLGPRTCSLVEYELSAGGIANKAVVSRVFHCSPTASTSRMMVWMVATELAFSRINSLSSSMRVLSHSSVALLLTIWNDWSATSASCAGDAGISTWGTASETRRVTDLGVRVRTGLRSRAVLRSTALLRSTTGLRCGASAGVGASTGAGAGAGADSGL